MMGKRGKNSRSIVERNRSPLRETLTEAGRRTHARDGFPYLGQVVAMDDERSAIAEKRSTDALFTDHGRG